MAAAVLRAAGIRAELPGAVDEVDPAARELFGYVVREAVTNVVRHSRARTCRVTVSRGHDRDRRRRNGVAAGADGGPAGHGLRGLADRVAAAGGRLEAGPVPGGGFRVAVALHAVPRRPAGRTRAGRPGGPDVTGGSGGRAR